MSENIEDIDKKEESGDSSLGIFINPRTDFGFKKVFLDNKEAMLSISNAVIYEESQAEGHIESITFQPVEFLGDVEADRHAIVDVHARTSTGEYIVVEMQYAHPMNFENRLAAYSSYMIRKQIPPRGRKQKDGDKATPWHYQLKANYIIAITNFPMFTSSSEAYKDTVIDRVQLVSTVTKNVFSDIINILIVDLTRFNKQAEELKTTLDYWLYTLKYAELLTERPDTIKGEFFENLYEDILRTNKLTPEEMKAYNESMEKYGDLSLFTDYSRMEGIAIGEKRGKEEGIAIGEKRGEKRGEKKGIAKVVLSIAENGFSAEYIAGLTKLSTEQIYAILQNKK